MSSVPPPPETVDQQLGGERRIVDEKPSTRIRVTCSHDRNGRIIVISADGTSNEFGEKNTYVLEFFSRIFRGEKQLTFYISGIGTHTTSKIGRLVDMAFANSFERNLLLAYKWLADNYKPGDRIFLFGFSRGAYQVRVIAGMIERVGLIYPGYSSQLPAVFKLYMSTTEVSREVESASYRKSMELCETFKAAFSQPNVKVHFVGVWDTVSSVASIGELRLPETVNGMSHVCHFRHALALDERRVKFLPEYASSLDQSKSFGDVKEVWFAGSHSDIGGGSGANPKLKRFGPALRWMTYEAMDHGLQMLPYTGHWESVNPANAKSLKLAWRALELLPLRRSSHESDKVTRMPHLGAPRRIQKGQYIHESVFTLMGLAEAKTESNEASDRTPPLLQRLDDSASYVPYAVLPDDSSWDSYQILAELMEHDPFAKLNAMISRIEDATKTKDVAWLQSEVALLATNIPSVLRHSSSPLTEVVDALPNLLSAVDYFNTQGDTDGHVFVTLFAALALLSPDPKHKLPLSTFHTIARKVHGTTNFYQQLVLRHANGFLQGSYDWLRGSWVCAVAIPATGRILSASDAKVVVWIDEAERSIDIGDKWCVSFQADGSKFATVDYEGTVKIWDIETGKELRIFEGHSRRIRSLAFSPDCSKIAAGSWDGTIRVWDTETGRDLFGVMEGHTDYVRGLAFSPDGTRLASGSSDCTVRLWDEAGKSRVLEGHSGTVWSVACSKDYIISGSTDETIRVWDAGSGAPVRVLRGHTIWVRCVAFSPDFKLVASGSFDCTARLWDVSSGDVLASYDVGEAVVSIAFSFDGKQIVTGSWRGKVHIWNADVLL